MVVSKYRDTMGTGVVVNEGLTTQSSGKTAKPESLRGKLPVYSAEVKYCIRKNKMKKLLGKLLAKPEITDVKSIILVLCF